MVAGTDQDKINTMMLGAEEIQRLRQQNEILSAQMQVVGIFAAALGFKNENRGMSEDIAWRLKKHAEAMREDMIRDLKSKTTSNGE